MSTCVLCSADAARERDLVWHKDGLDIVRCPSCGLVFRADPPKEDDLARIYSEEYFHDQPDHENRHGYADYLRDAELHRANARRRLRLLARYSAPGRLLDVGCAGGFFVDEARIAGWDSSGIDVSEAMVDFAASELHVPVTRASFTTTKPSFGAYEAITMWDYIEHSIDPRRDLEKAHEDLGPRGIVALSTGDIGTLVARLSGSRWHLLTPEHHNFFFDEGTLRRLLAGTGFDVLEARHRSGLYSVSHVLYKLGTSGPTEVVRRAASRAGRSRLGQLGVPLNLFDIVTVVARRR